MHLLTGFEYSKNEYLDIIKKAIDMKNNNAKYQDTLKGKTVILMFEKPSLRTRTTFEIAAYRLGAQSVYLDLQSGDLGKRESISDYACNLSRWSHALVGRVFSQKTLEELSLKGSVPVLNALSDIYHPAQAIADYMTIYEHLNKIEGVKIAYLGDGNNVTNSLLVAASILGAHVTCFCPQGNGPDTEVFLKAQEIAKDSGSHLNVTSDISLLHDFDVVYTDTWVSMGDNTSLDDVLNKFKQYQLNKDNLNKSGAKLVMHCLPAHRGYEITDEVIDGSKSVVFDEAENRLYTHMALLHKYMQ